MLKRRIVKGLLWRTRQHLETANKKGAKVQSTERTKHLELIKAKQYSPCSAKIAVQIGTKCFINTNTSIKCAPSATTKRGIVKVKAMHRQRPTMEY